MKTTVGEWDTGHGVSLLMKGAAAAAAASMQQLTRLWVRVCVFVYSSLDLTSPFAPAPPRVRNLALWMEASTSQYKAATGNNPPPFHR